MVTYGCAWLRAQFMGYIIDYDIEKGIPITEQKRAPGEVAAFLQTLEIGDSFKYTDNSKSKNTQLSLRYHAKQAGIRLTFRHQSESEYRAWRIA